MNQPPVNNTNWDSLNRFLFGPAEEQSCATDDMIETPSIDAATADYDKPPPQAERNMAVLPEAQIAEEAKRLCSPKQMEHLVLRNLQAIDGCPRDGLEITVYGSNPWTAMLRIMPSAKIKASDAQAWRERIRTMVPDLRSEYEVTDPAQTGDSGEMEAILPAVGPPPSNVSLRSLLSRLQ